MKKTIILALAALSMTACAKETKNMFESGIMNNKKKNNHYGYLSL